MLRRRVSGLLSELFNGTWRGAAQKRSSRGSRFRQLLAIVGEVRAYVWVGSKTPRLLPLLLFWHWQVCNKLVCPPVPCDLRGAGGARARHLTRQAGGLAAARRLPEHERERSCRPASGWMARLPSAFHPRLLAGAAQPRWVGAPELPLGFFVLPSS